MSSLRAKGHPHVERDRDHQVTPNVSFMFGCMHGYFTGRIDRDAIKPSLGSIAASQKISKYEHHSTRNKTHIESVFLNQEMKTFKQNGRRFIPVNVKAQVGGGGCIEHLYT